MWQGFTKLSIAQLFQHLRLPSSKLLSIFFSPLTCFATPNPTRCPGTRLLQIVRHFSQRTRRIHMVAGEKKREDERIRRGKEFW